jgi:hypothetical protein
MEENMGKSLILKVSLGSKCYRHIQIDVGATLYGLHYAILNAFDFDNDHMHAFFMNNRAWDESAEFICPEGDLDGALDFSDRVKLSKLKLVKGDKFLYIFDFGDDWRFQIRVLRVIDEPTQTPAILKSVGQVYQYGEDEDEEEDD